MRLRLSRPWAIVAAVFVIFTVCSGLSIYSMSVFLHAFVASGRFTIEQASLASSTFMAAGGLVSFLIGRLIDRHDVRRVMTGGALLMILAFLSLPWVDTMPRLFAFNIVLGVGFSGAAILPGTTVIARWFTQHRTSAMTIASTGNSFGAIALTPPVAMLIATVGLDAASPWLALIVAVGTLPLTWFVLRPWPPEADAADGAAKAATPVAGRGNTRFRAAVRSRYFWFAAMAFLLGMAAMVGGQVHVFNLMMLDRPDAARASLAIAVLAGASIGARFVAIWLLTRISNHTFVILLLAVQFVALAGMGLAHGDLALFAAVALFGSTIGNFVTAQSLLLAEAFGAEVYARVYGLSRMIGTAGVLVGPTLMGVAQAAWHDYAVAFVGAGVAAAAGAVVMLFSGPMPAPVPDDAEA